MEELPSQDDVLSAGGTPQWNSQESVVASQRASETGTSLLAEMKRLRKDLTQMLLAHTKEIHRLVQATTLQTLSSGLPPPQPRHPGSGLSLPPMSAVVSRNLLSEEGGFGDEMSSIREHKKAHPCVRRGRRNGAGQQAESSARHSDSSHLASARGLRGLEDLVQNELLGDVRDHAASCRASARLQPAQLFQRGPSSQVVPVLPILERQQSAESRTIPLSPCEAQRRELDNADLPRLSESPVLEPAPAPDHVDRFQPLPHCTQAVQGGEAEALPPVPDRITEQQAQTAMVVGVEVQADEPSCRMAVESPHGQLSPRRNVAGIRQQVQEVLVRTLAEETPGDFAGVRKLTAVLEVEDPDEEAETFFTLCLRGLNGFFWGLQRLGGALPWHKGYPRLSVGYQWVCCFLNVLIFIHSVVIMSGQLNSVTSHAGLQGLHMPIFYSDTALTFGSAAGLILLGGFTGSSKTGSCLDILHSYMKKQAPEKNSVLLANCQDSSITLILWAFFVAGRLLCTFYLSHSKNLNLTALDAAQLAGVLVSSVSLMSLTIVILQLSRYLAGMVDAFCFNYYHKFDYKQAVHEWNVLQATLRMTCSAIQYCFVSLQTAVLVGAAALLLDFTLTKGTEWALTPNLVMLVAVSLIFLRAAAVTDACQRVTPVVNSISLDEDALTPNHQFLVNYITASSAGFHVFEVRLTIGLVIRLFYFAGLIAFTISTRVLST